MEGCSRYELIPLEQFSTERLFRGYWYNYWEREIGTQRMECEVRMEERVVVVLAIASGGCVGGGGRVPLN